MKCPNCGGEVDSQSARCAYCGSVNEQGQLFQIEIARKLAQNKLLPNVLIKKRTPEMVQMLLTRVIISFCTAAVATVGIGFGLYLYVEKQPERVPEEGSYAQKYAERSADQIENEILRAYINEIMSAVDTGQTVDSQDVSYVLRNLYSELRQDAGNCENGVRQEPDKRSRRTAVVYAFMQGYLQMTDDEIAELIGEAEDYYADGEVVERLTESICVRLEGSAQ